MANNILGLVDYVNQQGEAGRQRGERDMTRRLGGQIVQGDPAAFDKLAALDPQAAGQYQQAGDSQTKRLEGAIDFIEQAKKTNNPQAVEAAYQQVRPYLARFGQEPPATFAEAEPKFNEAKMRIEMAKAGHNPAGDPTGFRELHMKALAAGYQPGTPEYQNAMRVGLGTEGRAASGGFGFEKVVGADGRERMGRKNPRTGQFEVYDETSGNFVPMGTGAPLNGGPPAENAQPPAMPQRMNDEQIVAFANQMSHAGVPEAQVDAWIQSQKSMPQGLTLGGAPAPMPAQVPVSNPALGVSQSPSEKKYAEESGQQAAQLKFLPDRNVIEAEGAGQKAASEAAAKAAAERDAAVATKAVDANRALLLLDEAERLLPMSTGSTVGNLVDAGAAVFGKSTPGAQAITALQTIAGQLTSAMPRMQGPQSDKDVLLYKQMAGDLANPTLPVESRMSALRQIRRLNEKYATGAGSSQSQSHSQSGWSIQRVP